MKTPLSVFSVIAASLLTSCHQHYELASVSRTRLTVDRRYDAQPDGKATAFLAPFKQRVDSVMSPVLGHVAHDMAARRPESDLSNLLSDILVAVSKDYEETTDFAIYNMGGIRAALTKGKVTRGDVLDVAPFENKICFLTLTGEKVLELFTQIAKRGGEGVSHGVELVIGRDSCLVKATLHGKPIDPNGSYRVATIDYLSQGNDGMKAFTSGTNLKSPQDGESNTRNIIGNYFRQMEAQGRVVDAKVEGRIRIEH